MSKHTPGAWNITRTPNDTDFSHEVHEVCAVYRGNDSEANARLIAASPDLLVALEYTLNCLKQTSVGAAHHQPAIAALAKARGEA